MTPPEPRAEPDAASEAGESDAAAESPTSERPAGAELEADIASDEGGSEAAAESPTEQLPDDRGGGGGRRLRNCRERGADGVSDRAARR